MTVPFTFTRTDRGDSVAVYLHGQIRVADQSHPAWGLIVSELRNDEPDENVLWLHFEDPTRSIRENIGDYSSRVAIGDNNVLLDGNKVTGPLASKILRVYGSGGTVKPLVKFLENLDDNPSHRSRTQLFDYLERHDFQITEDGHFIAYKGLRDNGTSVHAGRAFVDGVEVEGNIPNDEGAVITMPRKEISDDPDKACHVGLHAGAWAYASSFGNGGTAKVKVNPADVVCIPNDSSWQKMRVCRYEVLELNLPAPNDERYAYDEGDDYADPWDEAYYEDAWQDGWNEGYANGQADAEDGVWR